MPEHNPFSFYETPEPFTKWLFQRIDIRGALCEPCVGSGAILRGSGITQRTKASSYWWKTNDIDQYWSATSHINATGPRLYHLLGKDMIDWHVTNPPFELWQEIAAQCLDHAVRGVAMYLRISAHEVLKGGPRRSWLREHPPSHVLFLPRFAHQRSPKTGKWATDSMSCCWTVWEKNAEQQVIDYAPEWVLTELDAGTDAYRARMDALMWKRS